MDTCEMIDISPLIHKDLAVYPGDVSFERTISADFSGEGNYLASRIQTTLHLGSHADAPIHYHPKGQGMHERDLNLYIGKAQVLEVSLPRGERIYPKHIEGKPIEAARILFKTGSFPNPEKWNSDYNSLSPELIEFLYQKGVRTVGIDTPSVDPDDAKELISHLKIFEFDMANLEGLRLENAPEGVYRLVALPLKLKDADGSPLRAILLKESV